MTTMNAVICPECKESYSLLEGKLPSHHANGDPCPLGGRDPLEWPLGHKPALGEAGHVPEPTGADAKARAADTKPPRRPRSDKGRKREANLALLRQVATEARVEASRIQDAVNQVKGDVPRPQPTAKRPRRGYIVAVGPVLTFASLSAACEALAQAQAAYDAMVESIDGQVPKGHVPPTLFAGRALKTKYTPATTIPATVKVVR